MLPMMSTPPLLEARAAASARQRRRLPPSPPMAGMMKNACNRGLMIAGVMQVRPILAMA